MGFASKSGDGTRNNSCAALQPDTYPVQGCEDFSCSELSASPSTLPLTSPSLLSATLVPCRQCPQPCCAVQRSCSWAELSLQRCPLARSSPWSQEPGPAQQHRELLTRGNSREMILNQAEAIPDVPSLSWGETLTSSSVISPTGRRFIKESPCLLPLLGRTPRI